jgi:F-type H+-transporting ATPase subunit a
LKFFRALPAAVLALSVLIGANAFIEAVRAEEPAGIAAEEHPATGEVAQETHGSTGESHGTQETHGVTGESQETHPVTEEPHGPATQAHGEHAEEHVASPTEEAIHAAEHVSFVDLTLKALGYRQPHAGEPDTNDPTLSTIAVFQMPIISAVVVILLAFFAIAGTRKREMIPGKMQNLVEMIVGGLDDFVQGILGLEGRHFVPFIGTLFLYIWINNLIGIVPFFKSPTSSFNTTVALAICVFLYVQWTGIRRNGIGGYLFHLAGEPRDAIGWGLVILLFPLHVIGELAKPMSLSLRLFGNIFGEETLIAVFVGLGVATLAALHSPVGLPLHTPFLFLALLTSTIQALVFSLLTTIYFGLMLPHHEHDETAGAHH